MLKIEQSPLSFLKINCLPFHVFGQMGISVLWIKILFVQTIAKD